MGRQEFLVPVDDDGSKGVAYGIHLQVWCKARRDLSRIREGEDLAALQRRKLACCDSTGRLNLDLAGNKREKRLIAFGLMILNVRAIEASSLFADTAGDELAAILNVLGRIVVVVIRTVLKSTCGQIDSAHARPSIGGVQASCFEIVVGWVAKLVIARRLQQQIDWQQRARLTVCHT